MFETLLLALLIFLFLNRSKRGKKPRGLDAELKELIENSNDATGIGLEIKGFLLDLINDEKNDAEKFSDAPVCISSSGSNKWNTNKCQRRAARCCNT
ncbi:MAG: hypothetical protein RIQ73_356 [Actinomycetota bacterium]